ncbi:precorrin-6y C5,15-methyltransferase (decarboxylating) subunit CbiE [Effusibacillus lacus]|uniref:Cobalamin biosynthesis protein CbiE n=1 Tax=Effusibacillus lacus TaxID=1348429 RepID=A0A292YPC8_9BACL|nr:precorrin-6y C5,15-methyltransferase (decarboxylating) subunit CbiE [Effusibacillus lacus]TCS75707.1 precorrin-6Y C5,15-methyltransferase (decarboxylating) [Effusibacillus lacus]GAX91026.1 cobalamin biosynthesis protein CbiE [Effusibacillus lacus]
MHPVRIIGIGDDGLASLTPVLREYVEAADLLVGGERHLGFFPHVEAEKFAVQDGLAKAVERIDSVQSDDKQVVVLASGDPNFYGIAGYLGKKLGKERIEIHPGLSSIQLAFARLKESWQDAFLASVHGKTRDQVPKWVREHPKVALLTDPDNSPSAIARDLLAAGITGVTAFVGENLGGVDERTGIYTLEEMAAGEFSPLNVVVLMREDATDGEFGTATTPFFPMGVPDHRFHQRKPKRGLITKQEVRAVSLAKLQIRPHDVIWDIGAATGSVGIEASMLAPYGHAYLIEKNEEHMDILRANVEKFGRTNVTFQCGKAPEGLEEWPDADAIFIGGTSGQMQPLLELCARKLKPGGRIVLNAATIENLYGALEGFKRLGMHVDVTMLQVARSKPILNLTRFESFDPVYIVKAVRMEDREETDEE